MTDYLRQIGALRLMLGLVALLLIVLSPAPGTETLRSGWGLVLTGVVPALGPVVFMVILFDMLMCRVLMSERQAEERRRYRHVLVYDAALLLLILLSWAPFLWALFNAG